MSGSEMAKAKEDAAAIMKAKQAAGTHLYCVLYYHRALTLLKADAKKAEGAGVKK